MTVKPDNRNAICCMVKLRLFLVFFYRHSVNNRAAEIIQRPKRTGDFCAGSHAIRRRKKKDQRGEKLTKNRATARGSHWNWEDFGLPEEAAWRQDYCSSRGHIPYGSNCGCRHSILTPDLPDFILKIGRFLDAALKNLTKTLKTTRGGIVVSSTVNTRLTTFRL